MATVNENSPILHNLEHGKSGYSVSHGYVLRELSGRYTAEELRALAKDLELAQNNACREALVHSDCVKARAETHRVTVALERAEKSLRRSQLTATVDRNRARMVELRRQLISAENEAAHVRRAVIESLAVQS